MNGSGFLIGFLLSLVLLGWLLFKLGDWRASEHPGDSAGDRREADLPGPDEDSTTAPVRAERQAADEAGAATRSPSVGRAPAADEAGSDPHDPQRRGRAD